MHPYERWIFRRYLANALRSSRFVRPPSADKEIFPWIDSHSRALGLPKLASVTPSSRGRLVVEAAMHSGSWKAWRDAAIGIAREPEPNPSPLQKRLDWLAPACSLNGSQSRALGLLARTTRTPEVRLLVEAINDRFDTDGRDLHPFLETSAERRGWRSARRCSMRTQSWVRSLRWTASVSCHSLLTRCCWDAGMGAASGVPLRHEGWARGSIRRTGRAPCPGPPTRRCGFGTWRSGAAAPRKFGQPRGPNILAL
jgi:hypothetical protein